MERPKYIPRLHQGSENKHATEDAKTRVIEHLRLAKAMRTGTLSLKEYSTLHKTLRQKYTSVFGRPKAPGEVLIKHHAFKKAKIRRKIANASRRRNRQ